MTTPIWQWSATKTAAEIRDGKITSQEVTAAHIDRMHTVNPRLNAVVVDLSDSAMVAAQKADEAVARGDKLDLLHGVPITIKENVDIKGRANPGGVLALKDNIAPSDAPVVANLKNSGAILLGLTNTPEFSLRLVTDNLIHGLTLNPWDDDITCGGSSGGAASSVAMGIGTIAHGNDIGGSLRWPAHCNGLATIRPSLGRVPAYNESIAVERPHAATLFSVQGPIARTVADVRLALKVMSRRDPRDPLWVPAPLTGPKIDGPIRVGVAQITDDMHPDPEIVAALRKAADHLSNEGYIVEEIEVPDLLEGWQNWMNLLLGEIRILQEKAMRPATSADFNTILDGYLSFSDKLDQAGYMQALSARTTHIRKWALMMENTPIILTPVSVQKTCGPRGDLDSPESPENLFRDACRYVGSINHLGLPSAVVPVGLANGHPVGVQLVAQPFREDLALDAAEAIERHVGILTEQLWAREK